MPGARGFLSRFADDRRGVSAIVIGLSLSVILGFAALAVDVGLWYADHRDAQGAADSAAYSAAVDFAKEDATGVSQSVAVTEADATAQAVAAQYGFTDGVDGVTVTVNSPPNSGNYTSKSQNAFEVIIKKNESLFFSALYIKAATITARAVALPAATASGNYCMEILNATPGASNVNFNISNGAEVDLSQCGIADNGPGSCAISASGGAQIIADSLSVVGNYCANNGASVTVSGTKTTGASAVSDPYSGVSLTANEASAPSQNGNECSGYSQIQPCALQPGVYAGGISVGNGNNVTMAPGVYYVEGGTFSLQGGTTVTGDGVTIVLTNSSGSSSYATANIANGANVDLDQNTAGAIDGIVIAADPASPTGASLETSSIAGGASMKIYGSLYFPTQAVSFSNGSSNTSACTQLIAYSVTFQGGANFTNECAADGIKAIGATSITELVE